MGKRIVLPLLLAVCILFGCVPNAQAADESAIIKDILYYYAQHQERAETDIIRLMASLSPETAEKWKKILSCWHHAYEDQDNTYYLPDTLPEDDSLCITVMGYGLNANGAMKEELIGRLQTALSVLEKYPNAYILCSGGGTASQNPNATEANVMANWLLDQGVSKSQIIIENRSYSTEENAMNSFAILSEQYPEVDSIVLVSSDYHLRRCKVLFYAAIVLEELEEDYTIVGWAGFDAGHEGVEDPPNDAESLGPMVGLYIEKSYVPEVCKLTGITLEGNTEYQSGDTLQLTVTAAYDNGFSRNVTDAVSIPQYNPDLIGQQTITVSYTENEISCYGTLEITVVPRPTETTHPTIPASTAAATAPATVSVELDVEEAPKPVMLLAVCLASTICAICALVYVLRKRH